MTPSRPRDRTDGRQRSAIMAKLGQMTRDNRLARLAELAGREVARVLAGLEAKA